MPEYTFETLSAYEFEELVRDLLQKKLNIFIESFKSGKDGGIDLRYATTSIELAIIQCKHYHNSTISDLIRSVKNEAEKIKNFSPVRYILATSKPLSPQNKLAILEILHPYCNSPEDILSMRDLNNLLSTYQDIEKKHYKLWLSSTNVLNTIINNKVFSQTQMNIEKIQRRNKLYVQTDSYFDAMERLRSENICIIAGKPGAGKTTLAEMLFLQYASEDYEPIRITSSIDDAIQVYSPEKRQIFYYDDFLGQTSLKEKLEKNEDHSLINFIDHISKSKSSKFMLTTREYILTKAKSVYETISRSNLDIYKYVIDLDSYSILDKGKILYNHLYFGDVNPEFINQISNKKAYMKIINHRNFNPRIIEWMTSHSNINRLSPTQFLSLFMKNLEYPEMIWDHAFNYQISGLSRLILICLFSFGQQANLKDLEDAVSSLHHEYFQRQYSPLEFRSSIKELENDFIYIESGSYISIKYSNPSIKDYIKKYLLSNGEELLKLIKSAKYFDQIMESWDLISDSKSLIKALGEITLSYAIYSIESMPTSRVFIRHALTCIRDVTVVENKADPEIRLKFIINIINSQKNSVNTDEIRKLSNWYSKTLTSRLPKLSSFYELLNTTSSNPIINTLIESSSKSLINQFHESLSSVEDYYFFTEIYKTHDLEKAGIQIDELHDDFFDLYTSEVESAKRSEPIEFISDLCDTIEHVNSYFGVIISSDVTSLREYLKQKEVDTDEDQDEDDTRVEQWREKHRQALIIEKELENMFESFDRSTENVN